MHNAGLMCRLLPLVHWSRLLATEDSIEYISSAVATMAELTNEQQTHVQDGRA